MALERRRLAVIGGGVAGIVAAWRLSDYFDVTIFDSGSYLGGHTNTVEIPDGPDAGTAVDTGFIVLNDRTYPLFSRFLTELDIAVRYTDMSFSVYCPERDLQYCSRNFNVIFAQRRNIISRRFLRMLFDVYRFWGVASEALASGRLAQQSLGEFISRNNFGAALKEDFLYPLAAAVWSSSDQNLDNFPAETFLTFFRNHGWLSYFDQPRWQTVLGGSCRYVMKFRSLFNGSINTDSRVIRTAAAANGSGHEILLSDGRRYLFDKLVIAAHADQVLPLLGDATEREKQIFANWQYSKNYTILHTDESFMPPLRRAWGAWNYRKEPSCNGSEPVSVTYYMNSLQGLKSFNNYFVTLNPRFEPRSGSIIKEIVYHHPIYSSYSVRAQEDLKISNGENGRWYCGSYCGYGFHEDAVRSAEDVAGRIISQL